MFKSSSLYRKMSFMAVLVFLIILAATIGITRYSVFNYYTESYKTDLRSAALMSSVNSSRCFNSLEETFNTLIANDVVSGYLTDTDISSSGAKNELIKSLPSATNINYVAIYSASKKELIELISDNDFGTSYSSKYNSNIKQGDFSETIDNDQYILRFKDADIDEQKLKSMIESNFDIDANPDKLHILRSIKEKQGDEVIYKKLKDEASQHLVLYKKTGNDGSYIALGLNLSEFPLKFMGNIPGINQWSLGEEATYTGVFLINTDGIVTADKYSLRTEDDVSDKDYFRYIRAHRSETDESFLYHETDEYIMSATSFSIEYYTSKMYVVALIEKDVIAAVLAPALLQQHIFVIIVTALFCVLSIIIIRRSFSPFDRLVNKVAASLNVKPKGVKTLDTAFSQSLESIKMAQEKLLSDYITGQPISPEHIESISDQHKGKTYLCILMQIDEFSEDKSNSIKTCNAATEKLLSCFGYTYSIPLASTKTLFIICCDQHVLNSQIKDVLIEAQRTIKQYNCKLSFLVGTPRKTVYDLPEELELIKSSDNMKICYGIESIVFCDKSKKFSPLSISMDFEDKMIKYISCNNTNKLNLLLDEFYAALQQNNNPLVSQYLAQTVFNIVKYVITIDTQQEMFNYQNIINSISCAPTLEASKARFKMFLTDVCSYIESSSDLSKNIVSNFEQLIDYIEGNYSDYDLNLSTLANHFGYSPQYLGRVFKSQLNTNFIQYLNDLRLQKAKDLLQNTDMPIKDIAEKVGINTSNYFHRIFKKQFGYTPSSLRNRKSDH